MADTASWTLEHQTRALQTGRSEAAGLWRDDAAKYVNERFLGPHETAADSMVGHLKAIERGLDDLTSCVRDLRSQQEVAHEKAEGVLEELTLADQQISVAFDGITRSLGYEDAARRYEAQALQAAEQAGSCCEGCASESGSFMSVAAPRIETALGGLATGQTVLTADETAVLNSYLGPSGYLEMNAAPREGKLERLEASSHDIATLMKVLLKLPHFEGQVSRGVNLDDSKRARYVVGQRLTDNFFTSTSSERSPVYSATNTQFVIEAKDGRSVGALERFDEKEVILPIFSSFLVTAHDVLPDGTHAIRMTQV